MQYQTCMTSYPIDFIPFSASKRIELRSSPVNELLSTDFCELWLKPILVMANAWFTVFVLSLTKENIISVFCISICWIREKADFVNSSRKQLGGEGAELILDLNKPNNWAIQSVIDILQYNKGSWGLWIHPSHLHSLYVPVGGAGGESGQNKPASHMHKQT